MKPIESIAQDGMPREVATSMLTAPRARLTARMRKVCSAARETVYPSESPIYYQQFSSDAGDVFRRCYTEREPVEVETKTARRFKSASILQLGKWQSRAIKRRAVVQRAYLAVPNSDVPAFQARFDAARQTLALLATKLDIIRDCAEDEINARMRTAHGVEGIRREPGSSVDFRTRLPV